MFLLLLILLLGIGALAYYIFYKKSTAPINIKPTNSPLDVWSNQPAPSDIMAKIQNNTNQTADKNNNPPASK